MTADKVAYFLKCMGRLSPESCTFVSESLTLLDEAAEFETYPLLHNFAEFFGPPRTLEEGESPAWTVTPNGVYILDLLAILSHTEEEECHSLQFGIAYRGSQEALALHFDLDFDGCPDEPTITRSLRYRRSGQPTSGRPLSLGWLAKEVSPNSALFEKREVSELEAARAARLIIHAYKML